MAGGRKQSAARVPNEGGLVKPAVKGKKFNRAEEEQLCRYVLYVSQDRNCGKPATGWGVLGAHFGALQ